MGESDAELVRQARAGSDAAFARLVSRYQAPLRAFLRRVLSGGWAEADDVAQETLLAAWSTLGRLNDPAGFRSWLLGIGWRRAQDRLRARLRSAGREAAWMEDQEAAAGVRPEERIALEQAMAELAPDQRACVALCLADGWSHGEAAEALGLPLGTVKSHVQRGRVRLLRALGGADD